MRVKVILTKSFLGGGPVVSVKHADVEVQSPFIFMNKLLPKGLGILAPKEDVLLVFLISTVAVTASVDV